MVICDDGLHRSCVLLAAPLLPRRRELLLSNSHRSKDCLTPPLVRRADTRVNRHFQDQVQDKVDVKSCVHGSILTRRGNKT